ncbi:MAG: hypothetical protein IRZ31_07460 [Thermogemmatispora sp.]|uniref:TRAFAC clade GTPase domain-containing protein n=1 Tax=Thermogemmatispora sp. TaxID=1968838 RepID=UPI002626D319|nr:hypothetical protein [Thermogemmatispora sp.]MBX5456724.1 hypothetical protein [Thermogemmatispora sp.]
MSLRQILREAGSFLGGQLSTLLYHGRSVLCPSCCERIYPGACAIVSLPELQSQSLATLVPLREPPRGLRRFFSILFPTSLMGEQFTRKQAVRICPHCQYPLPYNIERTRQVTIAIIGDVSSGKSVYIAVLLRLLEQGAFLPRDLPAKLPCLTPEARERYERDYGKPLFVDRMVPRGTPRAIDTTHQPIIYEIGMRLEPDLPPTRFNLVIYDTSGEDYVIQARQVQYAPYVLNADAIIFMLDPVAIPAVRASLPNDPHFRYGHNLALGHPLDSFSKIVQPLVQARARRPRPLAITLSKADLLKKLRPVGQQYGFLKRAPDYSGGLDLNDLASVDQEVRQLLYEYDLGRFLATVEFYQGQLFAPVCYTAVSALGYTPDEQGSIPTVSPWRCLDPFLWVLHELGLLPARARSASGLGPALHGSATVQTPAYPPPPAYPAAPASPWQGAQPGQRLNWP